MTRLTPLVLLVVALLAGCLQHDSPPLTHTTCVNETTSYHKEHTNLTVAGTNVPLTESERADTYCSEWRSA